MILNNKSYIGQGGLQIKKVLHFYHCKGNILLRRKDFTTKAQSNSFGVFDQLILNLKKLLAKLPGGQTKLASYAAALWLIKEQKSVEENQMLSEGNDEYLAEQFLESAEARFMLEYADIEEAAKKEEEKIEGEVEDEVEEEATEAAAE